MKLQTVILDGLTLESWLVAIHQDQQILKDLYKQAAINLSEELQEQITDYIHEIEGLQAELPAELFQPIVLDGVPCVAFRSNGSPVSFMPYTFPELTKADPTGTGFNITEIMNGANASAYISESFLNITEINPLLLPATFNTLISIDGIPFTLSRINNGGLTLTLQYPNSVN